MPSLLLCAALLCRHQHAARLLAEIKIKGLAALRLFWSLALGLDKISSAHTSHQGGGWHFCCLLSRGHSAPPPLTHTHAHTISWSTHSFTLLHPMWVPHQRRPACISIIWVPHVPYFIIFRPRGSFGKAFIQMAHSQMCTQMQIHKPFTLCFCFFPFPGFVGSFLHLGQRLRTPIPCSENCCATNYTQWVCG